MGGSLFFEGDVFSAYVEGEMELLDLFLRGGGLSVPTWDEFWERGSSGWSFLPPFPTVSHSAFASSELTVGDEGEVGIFLPAGVGETTGASFSVFVVTTGGRVPGLWSGFFGAFFPGQTAER